MLLLSTLFLSIPQVSVKNQIIRALSANGSPLPIFETDEERTFFLTTLFIHPDFTMSNENENEIENEKEKAGARKKNYDALVMEEIKRNPRVTLSGIAANIGTSKSTVSRSIKKLKDENKIRREGSDKRGEWYVI